MTGPYMGSTGDQFAGADPRELERLRAQLDATHALCDQWERRYDALQAEVEQLEARIVDGVQGNERSQARVKQLEQALREYAEHQSWRCQYADKQYYLVHSPPEDDCACGFDKTMRGLGLYPDQRETT